MTLAAKKIVSVRLEYEDGDRITVDYSDWQELQREAFDAMVLDRLPQLLQPIVNGEIEKLVRGLGPEALRELGLRAPKPH